MGMGCARSPLSHSRLKTGALWYPSSTPAWDYLQSRRSRSLMRSLPPSFMERVWDYPSAALSLNPTTAACGPLPTRRTAQVFISLSPPHPRPSNDPPTHSHPVLHLT